MYVDAEFIVGEGFVEAGGSIHIQTRRRGKDSQMGRGADPEVTHARGENEKGEFAR